ncbi:hypothetical protein [Pontibacter cellulosilyticus]|uniref:Uncharacterized protein n=1 Tax=Pontibacter cellulosilyticus TaxID=1720253 RepID=A0A923N584_9BACT|nr:hypothetical protein [Pontibacter cellulosilyticus]MBC5992448.1 hypothetical protein [Pontibacter cellulosilyticus]
MKQTFILLVFVFVCHAAFAQTGTYVRSTKVVTKTTFDDDHSYALINGVKTSSNIKSLFKPSEIIITRVHSKDESMAYFVSGVEVKNSNHPVLKYFEHKARLKVYNKYFEHNDIPDFNPNQIASLEFHEADGQTESYLEVKLIPRGEFQNKPIRYDVVPYKTRYYDIDGKIIEIGRSQNQSDVSYTRPKNGEVRSETLCCREAYEKYKDEKYVEGIRVIRTK